MATGWTECMPLVTRESSVVVRAMERAQNLFPWHIRGADFDNDSTFMNDVVVPVALLAEMRDAQTELGTRVGARAGKLAAAASPPAPATNAAAFAKGLGNDVHLGELRIIHRRMRKPYKKRMRMPSTLDPHLADINRWLAAEPCLTALAILGRLAEHSPEKFGPRSTPSCSVCCDHSDATQPR